jgi:prohibitin 2
MDPNNPRETWNRFQSALQRAQKSGGRGGGAPKGAIGGGLGLLLLFGAVAVGNSALFNGNSIQHIAVALGAIRSYADCHASIVDGGHRAIKYTRLGGVKPQIYNEGPSHSTAIHAVA